MNKKDGYRLVQINLSPEELNKMSKIYIKKYGKTNFIKSVSLLRDAVSEYLNEK